MSGYRAVPSAGTARVATRTSHYLAEGPTWDPVRRRLLWVDIMDGVVHIGTLTSDGAIDAVEALSFPDTAGAVAVAPDGALVVAGTHRLYYRDADGAVRAGDALVEGDGRRLNDAKPDPEGRLLVGSKGPGGEVLLSIGGDGSVVVLDDDLGLSNGLAWSPDGALLYSIDTLAGCVYVRDYDASTGAAGRRRVLVRFEEGYPDGMTSDADGHLWVAMWGAGCVLRVAADGRIVGRIEVPAPHVSCPTFAGPELRTLVITTAREGLTDEQRSVFPLSGHLFTAEPGVRGIPPHSWGGSARPAHITEGNA